MDDHAKSIREAAECIRSGGKYLDDEALDAAAARIAELEAERDEWKQAATAHHPNPADHRYWEGRYRDEAARADRLAAMLGEAKEDRDRLWWLVKGFAGAVDTGRNEPLRTWRNEAQIALEDSALLARLEARKEIGKSPVHLGNQLGGESHG